MEKDKGFTDTFFSKLKEQSFTIILLVGIMLYQNQMFSKQMEEYKELIDKKEDLVLKLTEEERARLIKREEYLIQQRDSFIEDMQNLIKQK
jgi:low affinity Fe/Cu permease